MSDDPRFWALVAFWAGVPIVLSLLDLARWYRRRPRAHCTAIAKAGRIDHARASAATETPPRSALEIAAEAYSVARSASFKAFETELAAISAHEDAQTKATAARRVERAAKERLDELRPAKAST